MKPILFNTEMVQAIQDNRKTVTRRVMKIQPWDCSDIGCKEHKISNFFEDEPYEFACKICGCGVGPEGHSLFKSYVKVGDILYVREAWQIWDSQSYIYKASSKECSEIYKNINIKWKPSIHMPKEAARIFLKVTDVRVERLQCISEQESKAEGVNAIPYVPAKGKFGDDDLELLERTAREEFSDLWNSTIKKQDLDKYGWNANPWVWVIEFERVVADNE